MEDCILGIDLGGTKMAGAAALPGGEILAQETVPTPRKGGTAVLEALDALSRRLTAGRRLRVFAIGIPGVVDPVTGLVVEAGNIQWQRFPLLSHLQAAHPGTVIRMDNDVNVAARGELHYGVARGCADFIYVTVGTGIGGGIYTGGRLLHGPRWAAGEVGHMVLDPGGAACSCGGRGCLETLAAAPALAREGRQEALKDPGSLLHRLAAEKGGDITARLLSEAYEMGDAAAVRAFDRCAGWLGVGMASLVNIFNPSLLVIGGGVSLAGEKLLKRVREKIQAHGMKVQAAHVKVAVSGLKDQAGLYGAVALALSREEETGQQ